MSETFGNDIITITDEDGVEYVLEVLAVMEMDGTDYYALVPAESDEEEDLEGVLGMVVQCGCVRTATELHTYSG